ncbi:cytochrome C oxidase subunit IV family protein [Mycobacterium sp. pV006]|uniref:cytochrome C oxidase subunit IV family protein n=1 Tax=Mycobacterium sp. pV006 TaxID=3238983 RepID=UPI00351B06F2
MTTVFTRDRGPTTQRAITWAWVVLVAITIGSWWLAPAHFTETVEPSTPITALVLALTVIKSRLVMQYFMEVRTAPRWLRRATDGWLAGLVVVVFVIYLF